MQYSNLKKYYVSIDMRINSFKSNLNHTTNINALPDLPLVCVSHTDPNQQLRRSGKYNKNKFVQLDFVQ